MNITITSERGSVVINRSPFALAEEINLSGLKASVSMVDTNRDGSTFINSTFNTRDVDISGFIRTYGMSETMIQQHRNKLYQLWNPKERVTVSFESEEDYYQISGYPVSFPVFGVDTKSQNNRFHTFLLQMTMDDPFIYRKPNVVTFSSVIPSFSFPMTFTDVTLGEKSDSLIETIVNDGVMDCPIEILMRSKGTVVNPFLLNLQTQEKLTLTTTLQNGEQVYIHTGKSKEVSKIFTDGTKQNFYYSLSLDSDFLQLNVGDNIFRFGSDEGEENLQVQITYHERLGGL